MKIKKGVWVVIPAKNEGKNIDSVIQKTKRHVNRRNIIVVDDGSTDNTYKLAKKTGVVVLKHMVNLGKGGALKTGIEYAIKNNAEKIIFMDADGQHNPEDILRFAKNLDDNDIVFSYREFYRTMPFIMKFGNIFINISTRLLYGIKLRDTQCGYRAMNSNAYSKIKWGSLDYSVESEIIANVGKHKLKYAEIPIQTIYSDKYKGTTIWDGLKIVTNMVVWRLTR